MKRVSSLVMRKKKALIKILALVQAALSSFLSGTIDISPMIFLSTTNMSHNNKFSPNEKYNVGRPAQ
jgi:hypothetical protein